MAQPQDKEQLIAMAQENYDALMKTLEKAEHDILESNFLPRETKTRCTTFEQGDNMRDVLMHIVEWQRLQIIFVDNIRKGTPQDFIPEPYRKDYKAMDEANRQLHQMMSYDLALDMLKASHQSMMMLMNTFSNEELFNHNVYKVTYTTTMGAYFASVAVTPYAQALKRLRSHLRSMKKK
ncbi:MAG: ClbS/DfsB family four-helix bundle protein [Paludibacteraceae bacterium]|nr:ClbS/DfsB family four-helix bundle protein [Paludibacteraceae bacterium]